MITEEDKDNFVYYRVFVEILMELLKYNHAFIKGVMFSFVI